MLNKHKNWKAIGIGDEQRDKINFTHPNLRKLGFLNHEKVLGVYRKTSIAVVCSRWEEPFGRTSLEAASNGCAVIISNRGGLPETITDGVIFNPVLNEFYWASKGKGAWCNNKRLRVSKRQNFIDCIIGTGLPHANRGYQNYLEEIDNISKNCSGLRRMGAASIDLAFVAAGKLDAYWERNLNLWDVSAGVILVKEAGGKITKPNGDEWDIKSKDILASNLNIHEVIKEKLIII